MIDALHFFHLCIVITFRLIYLDDPNAGAEKLAEILKAHLELDGLWDYIKDNLVGLVTDGDAVS